MMKHIIFTGALVLASAMTGEAMANCSTNQVRNLGVNPNLFNLLKGNTVCEGAGDAAAAGPDKQWGVQEEHRWVSGNGGPLWDYKRGPSSTIDPPTQIGNWSVTGNGNNSQVNYSYLGGQGGGSYKVYDNGGSYDFCNGANRVATVTVVSSGSGCAGFTHGAP